MAEVALRQMGYYNMLYGGQGLTRLFLLNFKSEDEKKSSVATFHKILKERKPIDYSNLPIYAFRQDPIFDLEYGYVNTPNCECLNVFKYNRQVIWNVKSHSDEFGRRIVPESKNIKADNYIAVYGGSRVYGYGVNDDETLTNYLQKLTPQSHVYNYGIPSVGPNVFLKMHENNYFKPQIPEKSGLFLYVFDISHEQRILGTPPWAWTFSTPYYDLDADKKLEFKGTFWSGRFIKSMFYEFLASSAIYQRTLMNLSYTYEINLNQDELDVVTKVFIKMRDEAAQFNKAKFAVVFFEPYATLRMAQVSKSLKDNGIEVMVFSAQDKQLPPFTPEYYFEYDFHPLPITYKKQAELLYAELSKRKLLIKAD